MKIIVRINETLYKRMLADLKRSHPTAFERVGFAFAKQGKVSKEEVLILFCDYLSLPDGCYVADENVGAQINSTGINMAMQKILDEQQGAFHVHLHDWPGKPNLSLTDVGGILPLIPGFQAVGPQLPHGVLLLSRDSVICYVWLPGSGQLLAEKITIVGKQMKFYA
ncbi:MAG TPA: hypothetical protein VLK22_00145 [Candidatus Udaeobacter sp.]|nr:hypothetical protein [Candidatus Udaeobacter sp.]